MPGVVVGAFFLECSAQSHQLCSVESLSNGLLRFEQLIIHDTKLIPPNTQHEFFSMNIRLGCRCWSMVRWSLWFPLLWIIVDPLSWIFYHQWLYDAKKPFRLCLVSSISYVKNRRSTFLSFNSYGTQFPCFWIIPNDFKRYEIVCWVTPNVSASSFCGTNLHPIMLPIPRLRTLSAFCYVLCLRRQIHHS